MGRRGRLPDPNSKSSRAAIDKARHIAGISARSKSKPKPTDAPKPPASIANDAQAIDFWNRHAPQLAAAGRLRAEQSETFAILCQLHADGVLLAKQVAAEGWITATDKGQAASPVAKLLRDARRDFITLARDFGLTAASEARLPADPNDGQEEDDEAALLRSFTVKRQA
jgi:P27 family predicted phage terminase small subunit